MTPVPRVPLAIVGAPAVGHVDEHGYVWVADGARVEWWILGDDGWHAPRASPSRRQRSVDNSPIVETSIRVPGGDVAWRVGAAFTDGGATIVAECENRGSIPVAVGVARVEGDAVVALDVHPVTHSSTWRGLIGSRTTDPLPDLETVSRGWLTLARRGAQIVTNDPTIDDALTAARVALLVHHGDLVARGKRGDRDVAAAVANALTLLDYEDEAGTLRLAARLKPARKGLPVVGESDVVPLSVGGDHLALLADPLLAARTAIAIRQFLVHDGGATVDCLPAYTPAWRGRSVDVSGLPTNAGTLAYAVRWHGDRPALLWEMDPPATLTARAVDANWRTDEAQGEALLTLADVASAP
ncbi:MAG: hypothetical protein H0U92_10355 [Actinobacteria bacterium]|nr:hypothetical protein [Actinomycetota bacterium]